MIKVKHPLAEKNKEQEEFINSLPEQNRKQHELLFSYGNSTYRYYLGAKGSEEDFKEWLQGLDESDRIFFESKGFETCKTILPFLRYVQEKKDIGLNAYVRELMGDDDYQNYQLLIF